MRKQDNRVRSADAARRAVPRGGRSAPSLRALAGGAAALLVGAATVACSSMDQKVFTEGRTFAGGVEVSARELTDGYEAYTLYCYACHGEKGDGKGPASYGLRPPPRDFTKGIFKFARVRSSDELPHDDDLVRIVKGGLHGTAMLQWDIPEHEIRYIIQYIKTFAPEKWEKRKKSGEPVKTLEPWVPGDDPWAGNETAAIAKGKELYHLRAECLNCHPGYDTKENLYKLSLEASKREPDTFKPIGGFREDLYGPVAKDSQEYGVRILPPDFLTMPVRSVRRTEQRELAKPAQPTSAKDQVADLFRIISFGVYPIMPAWKGAGLSDRDIWAIAHYVKSIMDLRDTPEGEALKHKLASQAPFEIPKPAEEKPAEEQPAEEGKEAKDGTEKGEKADAKKDEKAKGEKGKGEKGKGEKAEKPKGEKAEKKGE